MKRINLSEVAREYCRKMPKAATQAIAKALRKDEPTLFASVEKARGFVRYARGSRGAVKRSRVKDKEKTELFGTTPRQIAVELPAPRVEMPNWGAVDVMDDGTALILSDVHVPFYDRDALSVAISYGLSRNVTHVILNGDFLDHYALSKFQTDPRERDFPGEIKAAVELLGYLRKKFPKAEIVWKEGNHEERFYSYMMARAPEFLGLDSFSPEAVFDLDKLGVRLIGDKQPIRLGKLHGLHGHEYSFPISNPVNPARGLFLRAKVNAFCGHFHQTSQHSEANMKGELISSFSVGALFNLHPRYRPLNFWNHGFALCEVSKGGAFAFTNLRIVGGVAY